VTPPVPEPREEQAVAVPPPTGYNDARVRVGTVVLMGFGLFFAVAYAALAVAADLPGLWAGVPVALLGTACIWVSHRRWARRDGQRGGGWMLLGCLLVFGSLYAAFLTSDALL
jgi:hypothetical protein